MKLLVLAVLVSACYAARLENTYLPPNTAGGAGGGPGLTAPKPNGKPGNGNGGGGPGKQYVPPGNGNGNGGGKPSGTYGPPGAGGGDNPDATAEIISYVNENDGSGNYKYSYETSNGIKAEEEGELKNAGSDNEIESVKGSYSYTDPEGNVITVEYTADENGFVATGDHLPTSPPIPEEILKSLEANAAEEAAGGGEGGAGGDAGAGGGFKGYQ